MNDNKLIIYKSGDIVDAFYKDETLWLSQKRMSELFDVGQPAIAKHLINIYNEKELYKDSTYSKMELVQKVYHQRVSTGKWGVMKKHY